MVQGNEIPCSFHISSSGDITAGSWYLGLHSREVGCFGNVQSEENDPIPMIILDGHESRLDPIFVACINDPSHRWIICLAVPYATVKLVDRRLAGTKWGVRDRTYVAKKGLVTFKSDRSGMSLTLAGTDAVPLVNKGIEINKKAIAERG
jgi:hypothetical protein